jgi:ABC-2 type transport system permease protein
MTTADYRVTLPRVIHSEWTKLRSLRSSVWSLAVGVLLMLLLSLLIPLAVVSQLSQLKPPELARLEAVAPSLAGSMFAQMAVGVLGVLLISGEYSTGMIRATLAAVPKRLPALWAKVIVFAGTVLVLMTLTCLGAFLIGQAVFATKDFDSAFGDPGVARAVLRTAFYITSVGLLGMALGALLRHTAAAIATLFGMLLVLPIVFSLIPDKYGGSLAKYLPLNAGESFATVRGTPEGLSPLTGFVVVCLYWVVGLAAAAFLLKKRDA